MMPNTTNALDGQFADLKNRLRTHNGLSKERKIKFIDVFLRHETAMVIYVGYAIKRTVKTDNPNNCPVQVKLIPDGLLPSRARFRFGLTGQR
jgi:hypothetical protein